MADGLDPEPQSLLAAFRNGARLLELRRLVSSLSPLAPPIARLAPMERLAGARWLAVLAGSFNPLTQAHLALGEAAERLGVDALAFALSTRTVDKERLEGALLEDRLLVLELVVRGEGRTAVALLNRGLYVDQAAAFRVELPRLERLTFLVGFDKIVQIFDPRYYENRDAALSRLFARADFAVAPRAGDGAESLAALLAQPENRAYASQVQLLEVDPSLAAISSSDARAALAGGQAPDPPLPPAGAALVAATGCYQPPTRLPTGRLVDRYAERCAWLAATAGPAW